MVTLQEMVKEEEVIILTDKERDSLLETFQHPPKPNEALKNLCKGTERKMTLKEQNEKQQKILDILKKKVVNLDDLHSQIQLYEQDNARALRAYNAGRLSKYQLTEEEYDLLKEWLKDDHTLKEYIEKETEITDMKDMWLETGIPQY